MNKQKDYIMALLIVVVTGGVLYMGLLKHTEYVPCWQTAQYVSTTTWRYYTKEQPTWQGQVLVLPNGKQLTGNLEVSPDLCPKDNIQ